MISFSLIFLYFLSESSDRGGGPLRQRRGHDPHPQPQEQEPRRAVRQVLHDPDGAGPTEGGRQVAQAQENGHPSLNRQQFEDIYNKISLNDWYRRKLSNIWLQMISY